MPPTKHRSPSTTNFRPPKPPPPADGTYNSNTRAVTNADGRNPPAPVGIRWYRFSVTVTRLHGHYRGLHVTRVDLATRVRRVWALRLLVPDRSFASSFFEARSTIRVIISGRNAAHQITSKSLNGSLPTRHFHVRGREEDQIGNEAE